jgi:hypothetical protein
MVEHSSHTAAAVYVLPMLAYCFVGSATADTHIEIEALADFFSDLSMFEVGPSRIHGRGLLAARPLPKGTNMGVHWIEWRQHGGRNRPPARLAFFPSMCGFPMQRRGTLTSEELLGCFPRVGAPHTHVQWEFAIDLSTLCAMN